MEEILQNLSQKLKIADKHTECNEKYALLKTDEERFKFTMRLINEYNMPLVVKFDDKSIVESLKYRNEGNILFTSKKLSLDKTIEIYTKSIVFAPTGSKELSFAYANRSAALFKAKLYNDCLLDINRALKLNYPDELKAKLFARRVRCLITLKKKLDSEVEEAVKEARKWLEKMEINNSGRSLVEQILDNPEKMAVIETEFIKWNEEKYCPNISDKNLEIIGASSAIELRYSKEFGKHIIATRDIKPGEILAVQQSYASVLVTEKFYTHCSYCLKQTWTSIPCDNCVNVIYCDDNCKNNAWKEHHEIECKVIGPLVTAEMSNLGLLSLRLAVKALKEAKTFEELKKIVELADAAKDPRTDGFTDGKLDDTKYISVYTLARNTDKRSVPDLFGRSLNAVFIVYILATRSNMFGNKLESNLDDLEKNKWVTFIGGLIMRHQQIIPSNAHSMAEENILPNPNERAAALMPFYSLYNHSCDPSVTRITFGKNMAQYALYPIKKGQQIFDNYGMIHALHPKTFRLVKLHQQFRFICQCLACDEDWPTFYELPSYRGQFLSSIDIKKLDHATRNFQNYYMLAMNTKIDDGSQIIKGLVNMINILFELVDLPCREINEIVETLKRVRCLLGNRFQSLDYPH